MNPWLAFLAGIALPIVAILAYAQIGIWRRTPQEREELERSLREAE